MDIDVFYGMCGENHKRLETIEHLFRDCEVSARIWAGLDLGIRVENAKSLNMTDWIIDWVRYLLSREGGVKRVIMFIAILWGLWIVRNKIKFEGLAMNSRVISGLLFESINEKVRTLSDQVDGENLKKCLKGGSGEHIEQKKSEIRDGHPLQMIGNQEQCNVIRVEVDAGWERTYAAAFRWVAYDGTGQECMRRQVRTRAESALQAEALGVRDVLLWAASGGFLHLDISSDCLQLINEIAGVDKEDHLIAGILEEMRGLSSYFHCLCFKFIPRHFNGVAHGLARQALKL
ncbi:uncharacterized protein LOC141649177 [Silene latifolia]|uniref:uncharacterized protein LOC141649177 n=1 Tax=Silene latifolia TaxID=37657 RepID=UPI003D770C15